MQCQKCGAQNNEDAVFCCSCGKRLDKGITCLKCGCIHIPQTAIYCPICGNILDKEHFHLIYSSNNMTVYQNFLKKFPSGLYHAKIKKKVNEMQEAELEERLKEEREEKEKKEKRNEKLANIFSVIFATIFVIIIFSVLPHDDSTYLACVGIWLGAYVVCLCICLLFI